MLAPSAADVQANPLFARLVEELTTRKLNSAATRLKKAEGEMRQKKLAYLRQLLLYTQLEKVAPVALWSEEAKHSIRLSGDCNILGLETAHCKAPEGLAEAKVNVQKALEKLCSDVVRWSGQDSGSDGITIAKATQLPAVLSQRQESIVTSAEELQVGRSTADKKLSARSKVLLKSCKQLEQVLVHKLTFIADQESSVAAYQRAQATAMQNKLSTTHHQLLRDTYTQPTVKALHEIRTHLLAAREHCHHQLLDLKHIINGYQSIGEEFTRLLDEYVGLVAEIENKQWALNELKLSSHQ
eukprot:Em0018g973a